MRYLTYILLGVGGLIAIAALGVVFLGDDEPTAVAPQSDTKSEISADALSKARTDSKEEKANDQATQSATAGQLVIGGNGSEGHRQLAIDLAQVKPDGQAVFAGQAAPGAIITIFEGDVLLGKTVADENGEWVAILEKTLAPGQHLVSVSMKTITGKTQLADATLAIEIAATPDIQPLVAILPRTENEVPKLLQSPDDKPAVSAVLESGTSVGLTTADVGKDSAASSTEMDLSQPMLPAIAPRALVWRENNELAISGIARQGVKVTVSSDGKNFAETLVMMNGDWTVSGMVGSAASKIDFFFTLHNKSGAKVASYELPVTLRDLDIGLDGSEMVVINKGDALWRIAYRSYGAGVRYVDIVRRNAGTIVNPDLIYPNQIFALPK